MYSITLEINQICNLRCNYCYLGEKNGTKMKIDTAQKGLDMAFVQTQKHRDKKLWIDFVGGEAALDFDMIQKLVAYSEKVNEKYGYHLHYSMTTNATIVTDEMIKFLIKHDFSLKISMDGKKDINDRNRISSSGFSVHDKIMSNMPYLKRFEKGTGRYVQVTNVITQNNYEHYVDTLVYLVDTLGFKVIDTAMDTFVDWTEEQMQVVEENIEKSFQYFIQAASNKRGFRWSYADSLVNMRQEKKKFYSCGGGIISSYVRTDGTIFACPANLDSKMTIGSVESGIKKEVIRNLINFNEIQNKECEKCEVSPYCPDKSCLFGNIQKTGDINIPDPMLCRLRKHMYQLYQDNQPIINRLIV